MFIPLLSKRFSLNSILVVVLLTSISSCKKESNNSGNNNNVKSGSQWTFDGKTYYSKENQDVFFVTDWIEQTFGTSGTYNNGSEESSIGIQFKQKPIQSGTFQLVESSSALTDNTKAIINMSKNFFQYTSNKNQTISVTIQNGKTTIEFSNISMKEFNITSFTDGRADVKLSGKLIED
jgi:hypothetical protein